MAERNWAGNVTFRAARLHHPRTLDEVCDLVAGAPRVRALGTRHSFNDIADTGGDLIALDALDGLIDIDTERRLVRVPAGIRYGDLAVQLDSAGWALANLASLPHISVIGAVATATHGSGDANPTLSAAVAAVEIVDGTGTTRTVERGEADFDGMVVGVGLLGVVTRLSLDIIPTFSLRQDIYRGLAWERLLGDFDTITSAGYSVSINPDWGGDSSNVRVKSIATETVEDLHGAQRATADLPFAEGATDRSGVPGAWLDRLPHFRLGHTPSFGEELQSEYLMAREHAPAALEAVRSAVGADLTPAILHGTEIRTVARDALWLSGAYETDTVGLHFTWKLEPEAVHALLPRIEEALAPFAPRPHWGKLFRMPAEEIRPLFPKMPDFLDLRERFDPDRRFVNEWAERVFGL